MSQSKSIPSAAFKLCTTEDRGNDSKSQQSIASLYVCVFVCSKRPKEGKKKKKTTVPSYHGPKSRNIFKWDIFLGACLTVGQVAAPINDTLPVWWLEKSHDTSGFTGVGCSPFPLCEACQALDKAVGTAAGEETSDGGKHWRTSSSTAWETVEALQGRNLRFLYSPPPPHNIKCFNVMFNGCLLLIICLGALNWLHLICRH